MNELPADIGSLVEHWRRLVPDREAIRFGGQSWSWAEFAERVDRNVAAQVAAGLRPGDRVAVWDRSGPVHLETMMACLRAGTVLVPVNFQFSAEEARYLIADARARLLIAGVEFRAAVDEIAADLPSVTRVVVTGGPDDRYERWLAGAEPLADLPRPRADACFLQIYTSGTTGFPKGAMLTGANLTAHTVAAGPEFGFSPGSVAMAALPAFHIVNPAWALSALYHGASVVMASTADPAGLLAEIIGQRVTHVVLVPATLGAFLRVSGAARMDYSRLEMILYCAAPMLPSLLRACLETFPARFVQGYGMTECSPTISVLGDREHRDRANPRRLASAGRQIRGTEIEITDLAGGGPLARGQVGEVLVRSRQVMLGYWDGSGPDTSAVTPDGWLRTGDSGYVDDDGYLYLTGRLKDMYIRGGANVYAAEVERVLAGHPDVAEAAVIGVPDHEWGETGLAFVVPAGSTGADEAGILRHCREHLADYKCPDRLVIIGELPRNTLGKVDKGRLRDQTAR